MWIERLNPINVYDDNEGETNGSPSKETECTVFERLWMFKGGRLAYFRALSNIPAIFSSHFLFVSADVHFLSLDGQAKLLKL
jgi:hypothetical protein